MTIKAVVFDAYGTLYDNQSVRAVANDVFPGYGDIIAQVWRQKQLEYTWLRTLMGRYEDLSVVTSDSLKFTLRCLGLNYAPAAFQRILDKYARLDLYPDAKDALVALSGQKLAILSNGNDKTLNALVRNTGLADMLDAIISVESKKVFKPSPGAYTLIEDRLGVSPANVLFVSCNPFDVCGAKSFGLQVAWIQHETPESMTRELAKPERIAPLTIFKILREQMDELGFVPDHHIRTLSELPELVFGSA